MDDQSRNLILATALSFLVLLGWFVLGPILFPGAFPTPEETAPATQTAPQAATPTPRRRPRPAPPRRRRPRRRRPPRSRARRCWRRPRACRSGPPASRARSRSSAAASTTSRSATTPSPSTPGSPTVTLLQPPGVEHAYYARYGWTPWAPLTAADVPAPDTVWTVESGEELSETTPGHAPLGQRQGPHLPPDPRHRRELHVHRHPVGGERDRRRGEAQPLRHPRPPGDAARSEELLHPARRLPRHERERGRPRPAQPVQVQGGDGLRPGRGRERPGLEHGRDRERLDRLHRPLLAVDPHPEGRPGLHRRRPLQPGDRHLPLRHAPARHDRRAGRHRVRRHLALRRGEGMGDPARLPGDPRASSASSTRSTGAGSSS